MVLKVRCNETVTNLARNDDTRFIIWFGPIIKYSSRVTTHRFFRSPSLHLSRRSTADAIRMLYRAADKNHFQIDRLFDTLWEKTEPSSVRGRCHMQRGEKKNRIIQMISVRLWRKTVKYLSVAGKIQTALAVYPFFNPRTAATMHD